MAHQVLWPRGLIVGIALFGVILVVGTVGFMIDGLSLIDAIFTTVSTVTTVGYAAPHPLTASWSPAPPRSLRISTPRYAEKHNA